MPRFAIASVMPVIVFLATSADAQWLKSPTPGIPRASDGKPDLIAAAPRTAEGKPDLSGVWQMRLPLIPLSNTPLRARMFELEFRPDERGAVTADIVPAGVRLVRK